MKKASKLPTIILLAVIAVAVVGLVFVYQGPTAGKATGPSESCLARVNKVAEFCNNLPGFFSAIISPPDCGGTCVGRDPPPGTPDGGPCTIDNDCQSSTCDPSSNTCVPRTCFDKARSGDETGVDCGGQFCKRCATCTDTDGGDNTYIRGIVTASNNYRSGDTCYTEATPAGQPAERGPALSEGTCTDNVPGGKLVTCMLGCERGSCYAQQIRAIDGNKGVYAPNDKIQLVIKGFEDDSSSAEEGDGWNVQFYTYDGNGNRLSMSAYNGVYRDGYWYAEYNAPSTPGKYTTEVTLYCAQSNSACKRKLEYPTERGALLGLEAKQKVAFEVRPSQPRCTDSDGGENIYVAGEVFVPNYGPVDYRNKDTCFSQATPAGEPVASGPALSEATCGEDGTPGGTLVTCLNGCIKGVCKEVYYLLYDPYQNARFSSDYSTLSQLRNTFMQRTNTFDPTTGTYSFATKSTTQFKPEWLKETITVFVYKQKALIIVGSTSPKHQVLRANEVSTWLKSRNIPVAMKLDTDISSGNLKDYLPA